MMAEDGNHKRPGIEIETMDRERGNDRNRYGNDELEEETEQVKGTR
jgi:hypothetical protein